MVCKLGEQGRGGNKVGEGLGAEGKGALMVPVAGVSFGQIPESRHT